MHRTILIEPRDPLIFRDPRPAEAGLPIRTVDWPLPSAIAGAIRTRLGRLTKFDGPTVERLKLIEHLGPVLAIRKATQWELAFPAPADALSFAARGGDVEVRALRPGRLGEPGEGTDLPPGLVPAFGALDQKPIRGPRFWTATSTLAWLDGTRSDAQVLPGPGYLDRQRRIHLEIDPVTLAASKGRLFATEGLEFSWSGGPWAGAEAAICSRITDHGTDWAPLEPVAPLGAERRLAFWSQPDLPWPEAPPSQSSLRQLRLQLITPAAFSGGWKPGWLDVRNEGSPPGLPHLHLRLVAAVVPRAVPHSGWDLSKRGVRAQKRARFLAPAGSVYFFETQQNVDARGLWLRSICDDDQDQRDGFGLVLCGDWKWLSD